MILPQLPGLYTLCEPRRARRAPLWAGLAAVEGEVTALALRPAASHRAVPRSTAAPVDHQLMSWREQIAGTCGKQLAWHGCEHVEHKH